MQLPIIDMVGTGENIRDIRKLRGMSVKNLQTIFRFSTPQAIYKWEQGISIPTIDNLLILSKIFDVSLEDIIKTK